MCILPFKIQTKYLVIPDFSSGSGKFRIRPFLQKLSQISNWIWQLPV